MSRSGGYFERGIASWYGTKFHGRRTSSGEPYDMYAMTAAHRTLPIPTYVQVTNLRNGRKIIIRVNDRGPFHQNRIIDLSYAGAKKLGIAAKGTGLVEVRAIDPRAPNEKPVKLRTASRSSDSSNFYLQVGAFAELINAERLKSQLAAMGESLVRINQAVVSGQTFYRVRIGPIMSVEAADSLVDMLAELGIDNPHFVFD
jgi:rare lipoprotein A